MLNSLLALTVLVPVVFWAAYHYRKDRHLPEPPRNLVLCFLLGIGAAYLSRGLYMSLEPLGLRLDAAMLGDEDPVALFWYAVLAIGPIEEFSKLLPFLVVALRFRAFDDDMDGIVYASFIALGYAAIENTHYLQYLTLPEALARGFAGPLIHIAFASVWGYAIGHAKLVGTGLFRPAIASFLLAAVLHGIYDFFALSQPRLSLTGAMLIIVALWVWRLVAMRRLRKWRLNPDDIRRSD